MAKPWRGCLPQVASQFTCWWMVSRIAKPNLDRHGIQPSLRRPIPLSAFEEGSHSCVMVAKRFRSSSPYSPNSCLDHLHATNIQPSTPTHRRRRSPSPLGRSQRLTLQCHFTELTTPIPLSDAASRNHLIRLPHLRTWHTVVNRSSGHDHSSGRSRFVRSTIHFLSWI